MGGGIREIVKKNHAKKTDKIRGSKVKSVSELPVSLTKIGPAYIRMLLRLKAKL